MRHAESPTVGELSEAKAVADEQVNAAVDAYLADSGTKADPNSDGYGLGLAAAVVGHGWASSVIASPESSPSLTRGAILRARAQEV
ncbi:hypothetical protein [Methylorubrum extorquens]|uniref:Uncharacterized protein n=1 Tax=Methylorubrum extorquens TaxID=408 RepID=A0AAX3WF99_METEX|nr:MULTISPECIES: hypothetical protein [Methylobacteriaceae]KQO95629.1 hypothetical protein ASF33_10180 [Methylobacterium sp. Leaf92]KQQ12391.1 hypothetical protein ASF56_04280 [Methylobacterium sp. Leaf122]WHQ70088.1 hypothetical protein KEC54_27920 [Methylorubrum extorquens]